MKKGCFIFFLILVLGAWLRLYHLTENPPSLYWDEVSLGYNAFSIANYGKDEHGENYPLARFIAFGDFKPPGYIYLTALLISFLGPTELTVRLPSALAGILFIVATYFLAQVFFKKEKISLLSSFFTAISPWSLQLSRAAFEAHLAAVFNAFAVLFLMKLNKNKGYYLLISVFLFILSFYTFNANRIIAPLLLFSLVFLRIKEVIALRSWLLITLVVGLLLIFPSISYLKSPESRVRFQEVSIFNNLAVLGQSNQRIEVHNNSLLGRLLHNRRFEYSREFLKHFFDHFGFKFLFLNGDQNPRLSSQAVGLLYLWSFPFLLIGISRVSYFLKKTMFILFIWLIIGLLPASLAKETPHALRTASIMPIYDLLIGYGFWFASQLVVRKISAGKFVFFILLTVFGLNVYYYLHHYHIHYPIDYSGEWQYGYKQAVLEVQKLENNYDFVVFTNALGRPYIYFLFYQKISPDEFLANRTASRDWFGFWEIGGFSKYRFGLDKIKDLKGRILVVGKPEETKDLTNKIATIVSPKGEPILTIAAL